MKNLKTIPWLLLMVVAVMMTSCQKAFVDDEAVENDNTPKTFTFRLYTPAQTRAQSVEDFKKIVIVDVKDGSVEQVVTQSSTDNGFGSPTLTLTTGSHTLTFLATDASNVTVDGSEVAQQPLGDTFCKTITIDTHDGATEQRVVLDRQVAMVKYVGETTVTIQGALTTVNLATMSFSGSAEYTLGKDEYFYTYVPESGKLTMGSNTIAVKRNTITTINDDGSSDTPGGGDTDDEYLALENDTAYIYVAKKEIKGIILSKIPDPRTRYASEMLPYRMPTRLEAKFLEYVTLPDGFWSGTRCLSYDRPEDASYTGSGRSWGSGNYYGFNWAAADNAYPTPAGQTIEYSIKPVRVVPLAPVSTKFGIDADFTWSGDTIKANKN